MNNGNHSVSLNINCNLKCTSTVKESWKKSALARLKAFKIKNLKSYLLFGVVARRHNSKAESFGCPPKSYSIPIIPIFMDS